MKSKMKSAIVALALTLAVCLLFPSAALAQGTNCPPEPAQDTPIADGEVYIGSNCTLQSPGDVDSFIFTASSGQTYHLALGINGSAPVNICLTLYDPNERNIFSGCTNVAYYVYSVVDDQALDYQRHIYHRYNREFDWHDKLALAWNVCTHFPQRATN